MKKVDAEFKPGEGIQVNRVAGLDFFLEELDKIDWSKIRNAVLVLTDIEDQVITLRQGDSKLATIGALQIALHTSTDTFGDEDMDEEDEDEDD